MIKDDLEFLVEYYEKELSKNHTIYNTDRYFKCRDELIKYKAQEREWMEQWK